MKKWNFTTKQKPEDAIEKLEFEIASMKGFTITIDKNSKDSIGFSFRKRILDGERILHYNSVIVNGRIAKTDIENISSVNISFKENLLAAMTKFIIFGLTIIAIIASIINTSSMLIPGIILIALVISLWLWMNKKFDKYVQDYKSLISEYFKVEKE